MHQELQAYMDAADVSIAETARRLDCPKSRLSAYLSGEKPNAVIDKKVRRFLRSDLKIGFIETKASRKVKEVIQRCYDEEEIGVVVGPAGLGKTEASLDYVKANPDRAVLLRVNHTFTARGLLTELCEALGDYGGGTMREMLKRAQKMLKSDRRVVIVDEADILTTRQLEILRALWDGGGCGLVLSGLERLMAHLRRNTKFGDNLTQLYSRVGYSVMLPFPDAKEVGRILHSLGVTMGKGPLADFETVAKLNGMRGLVKLLRQATRIAKLNRSPINKEVVKAAKSFLMVA